MAYVKLLTAWKNQDLSQIEEILAPELHATFVSHDNIVIYNMERVNQIFKDRFSQLQEWTFDVHYRAHRADQEIVASTITREDEEENVLERAFTILTFAPTSLGQQLIRIHMETELDH
ncbi:hypothetical protein ERX37_06305 [Macrococcus hajekii]|uniref:Nuclear transport factor 2 family protein n=1 Tax=Macrococcus hajekii TaxID=198482 RepID=A0A4R6BJI5_9STAP|nr:hypothetical protein [Macrococcus hajekii]TDM01817.1 hypothetical protein ERX37_06305 [Macrococcus hajekii]GGB07690.1 hypothetical protein GCM10007190_14620 [Macrococcus hajekii]